MCLVLRFGIAVLCFLVYFLAQVAGGLGERLGYDGIKLALPVEVGSNSVLVFFLRCAFLRLEPLLSEELRVAVNVSAGGGRVGQRGKACISYELQFVNNVPGTRYESDT